MPDSASERTPREQQLDALIAKYYEAAEQGQPPDQAQFLAEHSEFAVELREFFADMGRLQEVARPIGPSETGTVAAVELMIRDYRILEKIGAGGMGTVYLALHMRLGKTVALKILKADRDRNPESIARFEREMKAVGKLEHPHIVRALDAGDEAGTYFLVMEYIAGCDLGRLLQSKGRLEVPLACELIRQAALGLQHAHDHHLVHRDVKPSNLILSESGHVKVLDLGLAQLQENADDTHELTREGQVVGTWRYMAPEQLLPGRQVDSRSDIFSLGVTFYSFLVGELPINRGQAATHLPTIGTQRADVPPDVQMLLGQMLAPDRDQRIQSMTEVARVLEPYATRDSVNLLASGASRNPAAKGMHGSVAGTQSWSSTADEAEVVPPPVLERSPPELSSTNAKVQPRRPWQHFAVAGVAVVTLLVMLVVAISIIGGGRKTPDPEEGREDHPGPPPVEDPPPLIVGTVEVIIEESSNELDKKLEYDFIEQYVWDDKLYLIGPAPTKSRIDLRMGKKDIQPGSYLVRSDESDLPIPPSRSNLTVTAGTVVPLPLRLSPLITTINARIPNYGGASASYTGSLKLGATGPGVVYGLTFRTLHRGTKSESEYLWLQVDVTTQGVDGTYTETAYLLVDPKEYQEENKLNVKRGWISAESNGLTRWLEYLYPDEKPKRLVADFTSRGDSLKTLADRLSIELPVNRIPVNVALVLFFDAQVDAPPIIGGARGVLADPGQRVPNRKRVVIPGQGDVLGWMLSPGSPAYAIEGADKVPFLFANITITTDQLNARCSLTACRVPTPIVPSVPMNDSFPLLEEIADRLAVLRTPPEPFDVPHIPSEENAQATFKGTIQLGKGTILEFKTSVRTAGFPDENTCWLKIDVDSGEEGKLFDSPMTAWVLVSKTWAKDDGLKITRGWLEVEGEVLPFDGSEAPVEESLFKLGKSLTPSRLRVQQVLSLLFNAKLAGAGNLTGLRTSIDTAINRAGQKDRVHSVEEIKDPSGDSVTCEVWKVSEAAGLGFTYTIRRSRWIPFNFLSVDFASDKLNIYTKRVWQDSPIVVPSPFDEAALITLAGETQGKIDGTASPPDKDNQRIWRDKDGKIMFWGEFAGHPDGLKKRMVVLKSTDGTPSRVYPIEDFSEADKVWIEEGRHLRDVNGKALSLLPETGNRNPTNRAIYISFSEKTGVNFRYKNTPLKPVKMEALDARDQEWIRWWRAYKK